MARTHHAYPETLYDGGRMASTDWSGWDCHRAVAATLELEPDAVILSVSFGTSNHHTGHAPGGLAA